MKLLPTKNYNFIIFLVIFLQCVDAFANEPNEYKLAKYKKCMKNFGMQLWRVVDPITNGTYYNIYNYQWNKYFQTVFPIAIFVPSTVPDVQATVKCGFRSRIQLIPNSGAHSYADLSSGTNDTIIVDFRYMNSVDIDEATNSVTVGPGAFVGHVNAKLWQYGGWGTVLGMCMTVAMGGHAIGGGIGLFSSLYGLVIDNILEMKVVDARGNAVTVNANCNADLWWAMRGVGPGYIGIVTSIKLKMFKAKDLKLTFTEAQYKVKDFQNVLANYTQWLDWVKHNEPSVMTTMFVTNDNYYVPHQPAKPGVTIQILHLQDPILQPNSSSNVLEAYPTFFDNANAIVTNYPSYIQFVIGTGYTPVLAKPQNTSSNPIDNQLNFYSTLTKEMAVSRYFFSKSFYVNKQIRSDELNEVQDVVNEIPNNTMGIQINAEQGAIGARRATDSAYVHRNSLFDLRVYYENISGGDLVVAGKRWLKKFMKATQFMDSGATYQNFPDLELNDYLFRYYGGNLKKLIKIKQKWDPFGYFNSTMSIPTRRTWKYFV